MSVAATTPEWLTPEWLTDVLRTSGALSRGRVESFTVEAPRNTIISRVMRLRLICSSSDGGPRSLFLKTSRDVPEVDVAGGGRTEVEFFRSAAPLTPAGLLPQCYAAAQDESGFRLLLEDLSDTHEVVSPWPLPPSVEQCERILETYARFHGFWWDHEQLGSTVGRFADERAFEVDRQGYERRFAFFADTLGDRLSSERRRLYARVMAAGDCLSRRYRTRRDLTLVHGDAHVWNLLYPRGGSAGGVRLIDWDSWRIDTATDDLAYMMAVHWYPERRARLERQCLELYHANLMEAGVSGYTFESFWEDYRLSVVGQLAIPVWQCSIKIGAWIWWSHLERIMLAFEDLGCDELLG